MHSFMRVKSSYGVDMSGLITVMCIVETVVACFIQFAIKLRFSKLLAKGFKRITIISTEKRIKKYLDYFHDFVQFLMCDDVYLLYTR